MKIDYCILTGYQLLFVDVKNMGFGNIIPTFYFSLLSWLGSFFSTGFIFAILVRSYGNSFAFIFLSFFINYLTNIAYLSYNLSFCLYLLIFLVLLIQKNNQII